MNRMSVRGVIEHEGKYLLTRLVIADSFWCLPGGGVDQGEDLLAALKRELVEELGIAPDIGNLLFVHQLMNADGTVDSTSFFFHVKNARDYLNFDLDSTTHGRKEILECGFLDAAQTHVLPGFLKTELQELREQGYNLPTRVRITNFEDK